MDAIIRVYFSYLPCTFMQLITGFLKEEKGYFLSCVREVLKEALYLKIWPEINVWLKCIETYHLDRANNEVVQLNLISLKFLYLLCIFRVILLQDLVILCKQVPLYPLWKDFLFSCKEYQRFIIWVKSSLANIVTLDKVIIRKYQPTYKAVAKLRYKAAILEIKGV